MSFPSPRLRPRFRGCLLVIAVGVLASGCKEEAPAQQAPVDVVVQEVKPESIEVAQTLAGRAVAYMVSDVRPQVGGILRERLFKEGDMVQAGQVLYQIDPSSYQASVEAARADLAQAEAAVLSARPKAARVGVLVAEQAISRQDGDDATATLRQVEAAVQSASAALRSARINLDYTRVTAPISGRIGTSSYTPGALVSAGQAEVLATIKQLDPIYIDVTQSSAQLLKLRRQLAAGHLKAADGKPIVSVTLEDGTPYDTTGTLEVVESEVDQATGAVLLRAVIPNPEGTLLPGMYLRASLAIAVNEEAIVVPQQAVTRDAKGNPQAMVVTGDNKAELRQLKTGEAIGNRWVVEDGLKAGDRLIVEGAQRARPGAAVRIVSPPASPDAGPADAAASGDASVPSAE